MVFLSQATNGTVRESMVWCRDPSKRDLTTATADQLTAEQCDTAGPLLDGRGWGFGLSIIGPAEIAGTGPSGYGWSGGFGTTWVTDPEEGLVAVLCTQVLSSTGSSAVEAAFWPAVYQALDS